MGDIVCLEFWPTIPHSGPLDCNDKLPLVLQNHETRFTILSRSIYRYIYEILAVNSSCQYQMQRLKMMMLLLLLLNRKTYVIEFGCMYVELGKFYVI